MKILRRPIVSGSGYTYILSPRCFYWGRGRLYVGYNIMSKLHPGDEPLWDPVPVAPFTVMEAMGGFFQLTQVQTEGGPYYRKWATLESHLVIQPCDYGDGFLKKQIDQGEIESHNVYTLEPSTMLRFEHEWGRETIARWENPDRLIPKIERQLRLSRERAVNGKQRKNLEELFPFPRILENRARMIARYARLRRSNSNHQF